MKRIVSVILMLCALACAADPAAAEDLICDRITDPALTGPSPQTVPGTDSYTYRQAEGRALRVHVLRPPAGKSTGAAVVAFAVGGWMFGRADGFMPNGERLAARGLTVIMPDIRNYCRDRVGILDEVADANAAMRWAHQHADELGIDPDRIAAAGGSSGGHIALSTAMFSEIGAGGGRDEHSQPSTLLLFFPCVDPTAEVEQAVSAPAIGANGAQVSPLLHLGEAKLPPMLVLQGTDDPLYSSVNVFCDRANALGNSCEYHEYQDAKHGFLRPGQDHYEEGMADLAAYLERLGYISPAT